MTIPNTPALSAGLFGIFLGANVLRDRGRTRGRHLLRAVPRAVQTCGLFFTMVVGLASRRAPTASADATCCKVCTTGKACGNSRKTKDLPQAAGVRVRCVVTIPSWRFQVALSLDVRTD
jgi:hypothetical protein